METSPLSKSSNLSSWLLGRGWNVVHNSRSSYPCALQQVSIYKQDDPTDMKTVSGLLVHTLSQVMTMMLAGRVIPIIRDGYKTVI
mmetsp:Transcript_23289/g.28143  ORF Transcript_23289/g.28143 Transcript_23289/m.28143 type:complete len:85 (-) Transcript_23289:2116-2370(-)